MQKQKSNIFKPFLAAASSAAVIAISLTGYQYFSHKVDNTLNDKQITHNQTNISSNSSTNSKEKAVDNTTINQDKKQQIAYDTTKDKHLTNKNNISQSTNTNPAPSTTQDKKTPIVSSNSTQTNSSVEPTANNDISTVNTTSQSEISKDMQSNTEIISTTATRNLPIEKSSNTVIPSGTNPTVSASSDTVSTAEAEKYWGSKLVMPSYIPNSFELTNISTPNDNKKYTLS